MSVDLLEIRSILQSTYCLPWVQL